MTDSLRPTWVDIDLSALCHNCGVLQGLLAENTQILAIVKADAYGHGAIHIARALTPCGISGFGVATIEEGVELRDAGISMPILVMGGLLGEGARAAEAVIAHQLIPVMHTAQGIAVMEQAAAARDVILPIHLKIDTGMGRLGVRPENLPTVLTQLSQSRHLRLEGVMTHLAQATDASSCAHQMSAFETARHHVEQAVGPVSLWHVANSDALLAQRRVCLPDSRCWVRIGLALYGAVQPALLSHALDLQPVMSWHSRVALVKWVPEGSAVSYGATFVAKRPTRIAVLPVGYADGYPWSVSNTAQVLLRGKRVPLIGRVTMDMVMLDVTDMPEIRVGDEAVLLGRQGSDVISATQLAEWAGTIPYEIVCRISKRVPRYYVNGGL